MDLGGQFEMGCVVAGPFPGRCFQFLDHRAGQGHCAGALGGGGAGQFQQQAVASGHRAGRFARGDEAIGEAHAPVRVRGHLHRHGDAFAELLGELLDPPVPRRCPVRMGGEAGQDGRRRPRLGQDFLRQPYSGIQTQVARRPQFAYLCAVGGG